MLFCDQFLLLNMVLCRIVILWQKIINVVVGEVSRHRPLFSGDCVCGWGWGGGGIIPINAKVHFLYTHWHDQDND